MKKVLSIFVCAVILAFTAIPAFAWETPGLKLAAQYDEKKQEITVEYRVLDFAGTESAGFCLKYDADVVELKEYDAKKLGSGSYVEIGATQKESVYIQYINLYYMPEEQCEEDGSAVLATLTFKVVDEKALDTVFIATCESCNMDPDSVAVNVKRDTLKLNFAETVSETAEESLLENDNMKKAIFGAIVALVMFVAILVAIVLKDRKM